MTEGMDVRPKSTEDLEHENRVERLKLLDAIVRGLEDVQAGRVVDNREAMRRLKKIAVG
jgi:predicted transcriptional regulator